MLAARRMMINPCGPLPYPPIPASGVTVRAFVNTVTGVIRVTGSYATGGLPAGTTVIETPWSLGDRYATLDASAAGNHFTATSVAGATTPSPGDSIAPGARCRDTSGNFLGVPTTDPSTFQPDLCANRSTTIVDDFNRADSATTIGSTIGGVAWTNLIGTCGISTNRAYPATYSTGAYLGRAIIYIDRGSPDGTLQMTSLEPGAVGDTASSLAFRIQDDKHYWLLGGVGLQIVSDGGGFLAFNTVISAPISDGDVAKVVLDGSTIEAFVNGVSVGSVTDSTYLSETKHGIEFETGPHVPFADDWSYTY